MLNVSGHLLSTAQVESALIEHKGLQDLFTNFIKLLLDSLRFTFLFFHFTAVAESAVVPISHDVKGEALYCFVTLRDGHEFSRHLAAELKSKGLCALATF